MAHMGLLCLNDKPFMVYYKDHSDFKWDRQAGFRKVGISEDFTIRST